MPRWYGMSPAVRQVFRQYVPAVAASFLMGGTSHYRSIHGCDAGVWECVSLSVRQQGDDADPRRRVSLAVSTAVLPHFSQMVAMNNLAGVRHTLITYSRLILIVDPPVTVLLIYYSEPLVRLLLQRGAFTETDTEMVSQVQSVYLLQVPLYVLSILFVRVISSLKANHLLLWGTVINLILCVILTYILVQWFQVVGIALSISLMYLISTLYLVTAGIRLTNTNPRS